jgi:hypothetical protein
MNIKKIPLICFLLMFLLTTSCGSYLFDGIVEEEKEQNPVTILQNATSVEDYEEAESILLSQYNEETNVKKKKVIAHNLAKAKVGVTGANNVVLISKIAAAGQATGGSKKNVVKSVQDYVKDRSLESHASLNQTDQAIGLMAYSHGADELIVASLDSKAKVQLLADVDIDTILTEIEKYDIQENPEIISDLLFLGNTCLTQVVALLSTRIAVDIEGEIEKVNEEHLASDILKFLMDVKVIISESEKTLIHDFYGLGRILGSAIIKADIFSDKQVEEIRKVEMIACHLKDLYEAYILENLEFKFHKYDEDINKIEGDLYEIAYDLTSEEDILAAMESIFTRITKI